MLGAVAGDIIGSPFEWLNTDKPDFEMFRTQNGTWHGRSAASHPHFTDDTVITLAVAQWLSSDPQHDKKTLVRCMTEFAAKYPQAGYSPRFWRWLQSDYHNPVLNHGNGTAMRVSPVGMYIDDLSDVMRVAMISAEVSHSHPDAITGAQAVAQAVWMARHGRSKEDIEFAMSHDFGYDLHMETEPLRALLRGCAAEPIIVNGEETGETYYRETGRIDSSCKLSVTAALTAFLGSNGYEDAVRRSIALGGDSDTIAAICGSIAAPFFGGVPEEIARKCDQYLDGRLRSTMSHFEDLCAGVKHDKVKVAEPTVKDSLAVIRTEEKPPVFVVEKDRTDVREFIKSKFGDGTKIIEPKEMTRTLRSMTEPPRDGTYVENPRPDIRPLRFENGELRGPLTYTGPNAAPIEERQAAYSAMREIIDYAKQVKAELQKRSGFSDEGAVRYEHAYYPVIYHNRVDIYQGAYLDGSISFDEYYGKMRIAEDGDFREGEYQHADWCRERVFDSRKSYLDVNGIKAAIGRFCLDDGVSLNDLGRKSNIDTAAEDIAASQDPRINPSTTTSETQKSVIRIK